MFKHFINLTNAFQKYIQNINKYSYSFTLTSNKHINKQGTVLHLFLSII